MKISGFFTFVFAAFLCTGFAYGQICPLLMDEEAKYVMSSTHYPMAPAAVTVAYDFTRPDCDGVEHQLYGELEAGKVILLEFAMSCTSCENARIMFEDIEAEFSQSHPDRFFIYTMSYSNAATCDKMKLWPVVKNHANPSFTGVANQISYYGGFGMPTVVVVGGSDHKVYYLNTKGIRPDSAEVELARIREAITAALTTAAVEMPVAPENEAPFAVFPNPAHDKITLSLPNELAMLPKKSRFSADIRITNHIGLVVDKRTVQAYGEVTLDISAFSPGVYRIIYSREDRTPQSALFVKY